MRKTNSSTAQSSLKIGFSIKFAEVEPERLLVPLSPSSYNKRNRDIMFIKKVTDQLEKYKIPYALVGGYAVALHGAVRGTVDVDFVISWSLKNLKSVELSLSAMGLKSRLPISAEDIFNFREKYIKEKNLIGWNFFNPDNPLEVVDVIITYDLQENMIKKIDVKGKKINILAKKYLIEMKKSSGREQDLIDIKALEKLDEI